MHPGQGCRGFSYLDLGFRVQADSIAHLDWLEEFLCPAYSVDEFGSAFDIEVRLGTDEARFAALNQQGQQEAKTGHRTFVLDNSVIELPGWRGQGGLLTLYEENTRTFFELGDDRRVIQLTSAEIPRCRVPLMRVLREFTMNRGMQAGGVFLHASAVAFDDDGLLIAGRKNAGKTSLMTHFLRNLGADYLSNDRVYINPGESPLTLRGMPTIATIRAAMPPLFPGMQAQLDESVFQYHRTLEECRHGKLNPKSGSGERYILTPAQLLELHAARARPGARPRALLFPRVSEEESGIRAVPLCASEIRKRIPEALYGISTLDRQPGVFNRSANPLPPVDELLQRCERLAQSLPCFEVRMGPSAYSDPRSSESLLSVLLP